MIRVNDTFDVNEFTADPASFIERLKQTGAPEFLSVNGQDALVVQDAQNVSGAARNAGPVGVA
ncbi:MAG TPA: hypothetical protein VNT79_07995 [Phycisphaerae bacterium]|nr:hypothetical protein [Phycisphaerae bacterium]